MLNSVIEFILFRLLQELSCFYICAVDKYICTAGMDNTKYGRVANQRVRPAGCPGARRRVGPGECEIRRQGSRRECN